MEIITKPTEKLTKKIGSDILEIVPLGGGNEVGRSCIMIKFKGKLIMVDTQNLPSLTVVFIQPLMISLLFLSLT
jgi:hypothetical protein